MVTMKFTYVAIISFLFTGHLSILYGQNVGGSSGLPPSYLSVKGHQDCLKSHTAGQQHTFKSVCLPKILPQNCLEESWKKLTEIIEPCIAEEHKEAISDALYSMPSERGYCSVDDTGRRHEHCRCSKSNEDINDCKKRCDGDLNCKGYSFRDTKSKCYLYTTSTCQKGCNKRSANSVGDLLERKDKGESGCFIKQKGHHAIPSGGSCEGRCVEDLDPNASCQCNDNCAEYGDCCDDYADLCGSCYGRCDKGYDTSFPCQCNEQCEQYDNCCNDKDDICGDGPNPHPITDDDLKAIAEELAELDDNNAASMIQTNIQGKTDVGSFEDHASAPYFTSVDDRAWGLPTIEALLVLLDNYDSDVRHPEDHTSAEEAEEDEFLSKVMETRVMKKAYEFCKDNGLFSGSLNEFSSYLKTIWFGLYDRGGKGAGSSGFEHVFVGEIKNGEVSGFHDWVHFYELEKSSNINYLGYLDQANFDEFGIGLSDVFTWNGDIKKFGSMFVGTSPELIMALDTICFMARTDGECKMSLNNVPIKITTYTLKQDGETYIGTAYPDW